MHPLGVGFWLNFLVVVVVGFRPAASQILIGTGSMSCCHDHLSCQSWDLVLIAGSFISSLLVVPACLLPIAISHLKREREATQVVAPPRLVC